jgi:hypothetical protein
MIKNFKFDSISTVNRDCQTFKQIKPNQSPEAMTEPNPEKAI